MSSDQKPRVVGPVPPADDGAPGTGESPEAVPHTARSSRPLGRGLEDISHLFTRRSTDERRAAQWEAVASAEPRPPVPVARSGVVLLQPSSALTKDQIVATLKEFSGALEDRLRVIDTGVPCDPFGDIDLLGVDRANQLVIIDVETSSLESQLLRGVNHLDWITRNIAIVRRMYQGTVINFSAPPRLVLVAPQFSSFSRSAIRQMTARQVQCVRYHGADAAGSAAILLEPVDIEP